jgi:hypothetical protein
MKKSILLALAATIATSATACDMMDTIQEKLYKSIEKPAIYHAGVYTIDKTAKLMSGTILRLTRLTGKKEIALQKINGRLAQIEYNLKKDEINAINGMYKEFEVTDEEQQTINSILGQYQDFQKQYLSQPHEKKEETLVGVSSEILSLCEQLNIHPTAVELRLSDSASPLVAAAKGLAATYQFENDALMVNYNDIVQHPSVTLYSNFFNLSYEMGVATFGHELTHLALQHHEKDSILHMEIKYLTGAKNEALAKSKNFKKLDTIYERQAEILLKDAQWASIMRSKRNKSYYADHLFLKHYAQLAEIDELHKLKEKINA